MNWLDWVIVLVLVTGMINGLRQGFVRLVVGLAALMLAFLAASWFHGVAASVLSEYITSRTAASLPAYLLIFFVVNLAGWLVATLIVRFFRLVGLTPVDRLLGAGFGALRAAVMLVITAMLLMAFMPNRMPAAVSRSKLAPYVGTASRVVSAATPYEIRHSVEETWSRLRRQIEGMRTDPGLRRPAARAFE